MNEAEKQMALYAISLIINCYLPSIRGVNAGGGMHSLEIWEKIRANIEAVNEPAK
jgi:hypothetical protein